jgi:imidazole glycerol-phosphate synthase subunit HisF
MTHTVPQTRLIGRLDNKGEHVLQGIHLEGLRKVGWPTELAWRYYKAGINELIYKDIVASLYQRNGCPSSQKRAGFKFYADSERGMGPFSCREA